MKTISPNAPPCYPPSVPFARRALTAIAVVSALGAVARPCAAQEPLPNLSKTDRKAATVFQISTLPALSLGLYEGGMAFGDLLKHGDFGIGTFDALDGELVVLDGKAWRIRADGRVSPVGDRETTPFANVTHFAPGLTLKIAQPLEYEPLRQRLSSLLSTPNAPYAIWIHGTFSRLKVRSVPGQRKPYRPLAEVVKTQSVWEWKDIRGTLVGFRFPTYLSGVNLADYHFHFISDDRRHGGHLLDGTLQEGEIRIQTLRGLEMRIPSDAGFDRADLSTDQSTALQAAEKSGSH
ncbi:MAG: acetolactate decarboxylase [Fibrella sp.]|nr:acetolactate decarboxylase [Armatimonadota bacterium]